MKKRHLFASIFQIAVGVAAIIAYIVAVASGEAFSKWTFTLILAIGFVGMGVIGVIDFLRLNNRNKNN